MQTTYQAMSVPTQNKVLSQTFAVVSAMLVLTAGVSMLTKGINLGIWVHIGIIVASFALIFFIHAMKNSALGLLGLGLFAGLEGVAIGPLINHYLAMKGGENIVALAAFMTAVVTIGCSVYAMTTKRDFSSWFGALMGATIALLVGLIVSMFVQLPMLTLILSVIGTALFSAWLIFDVADIVRGGETNYITASLGLFLDIINIFQFILQILGVLSKDD